MERIGGCIENRASVWLFSSLLVVLVAAFALQMTSCVETAECNESVTCPADEVCYEFRCLDRCESEDECAEQEACTPCKPPDAVETSGQCFGSEASACLPQE